MANFKIKVSSTDDPKQDTFLAAQCIMLGVANHTPDELRPGADGSDEAETLSPLLPLDGAAPDAGTRR